MNISGIPFGKFRRVVSNTPVRAVRIESVEIAPARGDDGVPTTCVLGMGNHRVEYQVMAGLPKIAVGDYIRLLPNGRDVCVSPASWFKQHYTRDQE